MRVAGIYLHECTAGKLHALWCVVILHLRRGQWRPLNRFQTDAGYAATACMSGVTSPRHSATAVNLLRAFRGSIRRLHAGCVAGGLYCAIHITNDRYTHSKWTFDVGVPGPHNRNPNCQGSSMTEQIKVSSQPSSVRQRASINSLTKLGPLRYRFRLRDMFGFFCCLNMRWHIFLNHWRRLVKCEQ